MLRFNKIMQIKEIKNRITRNFFIKVKYSNLVLIKNNGVIIKFKIMKHIIEEFISNEICIRCKSGNLIGNNFLT